MTDAPARPDRAMILVVDDEPANRELLRAILEGEGHTVVDASNGEQALTRAPGTDLILLDVLMPGLTGIEVCERLKARDTTRDIPVVMVTALSDRSSRIAALAAGADEFLTKPVDEAELLTRVKNLMRIKRTHDALRSWNAALVGSIEERTRALARAHVRLERLDSLKTTFLQFMAHQLRTPLTSLSALEYLDDADSPEERDELMGIVRRGYAFLSDFVERGLVCCTWLAQERPEKRLVVDLAALARELPARAASMPGARVTAAIADAALLTRGDPQALAQVLDALVAHARCRAPEGASVIVSAGRDAGMVWIGVSHPGRKFPKERLGELFEPFAVLDAAADSGDDALNRTLASAIAKAHGGRLSVVAVAGDDPDAPLTTRLSLSALTEDEDDADGLGEPEAVADR